MAYQLPRELPHPDLVRVERIMPRDLLLTLENETCRAALHIDLAPIVWTWHSLTIDATLILGQQGRTRLRSSVRWGPPSA